MQERTRNLISRGTLAVVGLLVFYGGYACMASAVDMYRDEKQRIAKLPPRTVGHSRRGTDSGFMLVGIVGGVLLLGGTTCTAAALIPWHWWEVILRRKPPVTGESPEEPLPPSYF